MAVSSGLRDWAETSGLLRGPGVLATAGLIWGPDNRLISSLLAECEGRTFSRGRLPCSSWVTKGLLASTLDTGLAVVVSLLEAAAVVGEVTEGFKPP